MIPCPCGVRLTESVRAIKALSHRIGSNRRLSNYRKRIYTAASRAKVTAAERLKKHDSLFARCINANMDARAALRKCVFPEVSTLDVLDRAVKRELVR